jgi:hypothetical protein
MLIRKAIGASAFVLAGTILGLSATATAAQAHEYKLNHGTDFGWVTSDHRSVYVCDNEADNHGVYIEYKTRQSGSRIMVINDGDGSGGGCGHEWAEDGGTISSARICEHSVGCSAWQIV